MANLTSLNKLTNTRVFVAAEKWIVEVLELVALFLLKDVNLRSNELVGDFRRCYILLCCGLSRKEKGTQKL